MHSWAVSADKGGNMIYAFLVEGFEITEAVTPIDLMRRAEINVTTVSLEKSKLVKSSSGISCEADMMFEDCNFTNLEGIFLPGGPGTSNYLKHETMLEMLKQANDSKNLISAICAAPTILEKVGIKCEKTVYPTLKSEIENYANASVVKSGNVITGEGVGATIDFALEIIKYLKGEEKAKEVSKSICVR